MLALADITFQLRRFIVDGLSGRDPGDTHNVLCQRPGCPGQPLGKNPSVPRLFQQIGFAGKR